jgi:hypothetical protein
VKYLTSVKSMVLHEAFNVTLEVRLAFLELVDPEIMTDPDIDNCELGYSSQLTMIDVWICLDEIFISLLDGLSSSCLVVFAAVATAAEAGLED